MPVGAFDIARGLYIPKPFDWEPVLTAAGVMSLFVTPGIVVMFLAENDLVYAIGLAAFLSMAGIGLLVIRSSIKKKEDTESE